MLVSVLVEIKALKEKTFTYSVPLCLESKVKLGVRVKVPFGKIELSGLIIGYEIGSEYETKDIIEILDDEPILNKELIELGKYMSKKYICSLMSCYQCMLPSALKFNNKKVNIKYEKFIEKVCVLDNPTKGEKTILDLFNDTNIVKYSCIKNKNILKRLIDKVIIKERTQEKYILAFKNEIKELNQ